MWGRFSAASTVGQVACGGALLIYLHCVTHVEEVWYSLGKMDIILSRPNLNNVVCLGLALQS